MIDVIVPLYRNLVVSRRCVESVLAHTNVADARLVLVDDASPEPELSAWAASLAQAGKAELLRHEQNLGFVAAVNAGMSLDVSRDVVLLNSDTEVPAGWLERLKAAAHSARDIATVTPFSNNGSICSYPQFCVSSPVPEGLDLLTLDRQFAEANAGQIADLPTAVGFCMYIRRDALQQLGDFDLARYGRGYGEENDFSRRAAAAGLRNVLCADLFVYHEGAVSFGDDRKALMRHAERQLVARYPDYGQLVANFIATDPLRHFRSAVDALRLEVPGQARVLMEEWQTARELQFARQQESRHLLQEYQARCEQYDDLLQQERSEWREREASFEQRIVQYEAFLAESRAAFKVTDKALQELQQVHAQILAEREALVNEHDETRVRLNRAEQELARLNRLLIIRLGRWLKETFSRT